MSIATQLIKAKNNLANSRKAVIYKGGNVGEVAKFDNLASEIESIPSGDVNYVFVDDTDTAYRKQILSGASPLAKIKSIGGSLWSWDTVKVTSLVSVGFNLLNLDDVKISNVGSSHPTAIRLADGKLQSNIDNHYYIEITIPTLVDFFTARTGKQFTFSVKPAMQDAFITALVWGTDTNGNGLVKEYHSATGADYVSFSVPNLREITNVGFRFNRKRTRFTDTTTIFYDLQLNLGTISPYTPYKSDTFTIPEAVQALEGYGTRGSYIDLESKMWIYGDNDPVDISAYLPNDSYIEIEGGGYITAVNKRGIVVPFNIAYIRRTT